MIWWIGLSGLIILILGVGLVWVSGRSTVSEEQRIDAVRQLKLMQELAEHPAWKLIQKAAKEQIEVRTDHVVLNPTDNALGQEYMKGEVAGIRIFFELPEKLVEQSQAIVDQYNKEASRK